MWPRSSSAFQSQNVPVYRQKESNFSSCDNRERHIAISKATLYGLDGSEFDPPERTKFLFTPVQIGPGAHLAPVHSVTGLLRRGQEAGAWRSAPVPSQR